MIKKECFNVICSTEFGEMETEFSKILDWQTKLNINKGWAKVRPRIANLLICALLHLPNGVNGSQWVHFITYLF